ncbi:hypothetical protein ONZ45_g9125 [Pleurotus djamor]|nr:hypothetical protein ONZ45_g9125 [Pleurotus djamor]
MDNTNIGKVLNASASHIAALTSGIDASTEVATMCIGGRSFGQLLVYTSSFDLESRYQGMKKAFGEDMEILQTTGAAAPDDLTMADYDKLVSNAEAGHASSRAASSDGRAIQGHRTSTATGRRPAIGQASTAGRDSRSLGNSQTPALEAGSDTPPPPIHPPPSSLTVPAASLTATTHVLSVDEPNPFLSVHANFPIIKWGRSVHHPSLTILYTIIALGSMIGLLVLKWCKGGTWLFEIVYFITFLIVNAYTITMLDIRREICFIEVTRKSVSPSTQTTWDTLKAEAKRFPKTKEEALQNLRRGHVSCQDGSDALLLPVMGVMTRIEDGPASWWILLNELRAPLVQIGLYLLPDNNIDWVMLYGIASYVQARLQRAVTERYIRDAKTRGIFWFRKLKAHEFPVYEKTFYLDCKQRLSLDSVVNEKLFALPPAPFGTPLPSVCEAETDALPIALVTSPFGCPHELWLVLNLTSNTWERYNSYTLRLSWPASSPADFDIQIYDADMLREFLEKHPRDTYKESSKKPYKTLGRRIKYARIRLVDVGVLTPKSNASSSSSSHVPGAVSFTLILEPLYLGVIPASLTPTLLLIMPVIAAAFFIVPRIWAYLEAIAQEARRENPRTKSD